MVNPKITQDKIISLAMYQELERVYEFVLYGDNILEGITLLNILTLSDDILQFVGIVYHPIDQPIYIFQDDQGRKYAIKICGSFDKWDLPETANKIRSFVDLPDYIFYSVSTGHTILAGENTETASVGNSQWQREGRKIGAARNGVPFIYQTFYSGKDESQDTIREPNSLQVYNQLLYSIRYRTPSFVAYFENNFEGAKTRDRTTEVSKSLFANYIKSVIVADVDATYIKTKQELESQFFVHMLSYLKEGKFGRNKIAKNARLESDFPIINQQVKDALLNHPDDFSEKLVNYIYTGDKDFIQQYPIDKINKDLLCAWTAYKDKQWISEIIQFLDNKNTAAKTYKTGNCKVSIIDTSNTKLFLKNKFPDKTNIIDLVLDEKKHPESVLLPLRIHKTSNGSLTFSPDPESGEIAAFCELFGYDYKQTKTRPVIGYCIVDTPEGFNINNKIGTKLYKAIATYIDILILDNSILITDFKEHIPHGSLLDDGKSITEIYPNNTTEETAVVATYLNQTTIHSNWSLCFIHTHHSSWQQLVIHNHDHDAQHKIDRISTKVDLIMQDTNGIFMIAEGKNDYTDILKDAKIQKAMKDASDTIDNLCATEHTKFNAFIYNLKIHPDKEPEYYATQEAEKVAGDIQKGYFNNIASEHDFVIIIVYTKEDKSTGFKLVYSKDFTASLKIQLDQEFNQ